MPKLQRGHITTKSGAWIGHFNRWFVDPATGKNKRRQYSRKLGAVSYLTKRQAHDKLRELMVQELHLTQDGSITVAWFIENKWKPLKEGGWRPSTKQTNEELLKLLNARWGSTRIEDCDSVDLQSWLNTIAKTRSGSQVKHLRIFLMSILKEAQEQDYIRKNPARSLKVPRVRAVSRPYLTLEQIDALLKAAAFFPRDRTLLRLLFVTALRPSEIFALRWKSIDFNKGLMVITETVYRGQLRAYTKTTEEGDVQQMIVPKTALIALSEWYAHSDRTKDDDFIFPNSEGGYWWKENYQRRVLDVLASNAGIAQLNFQMLRRTVATHAQDLGSPKSIQTILRHQKAETAQEHYIQVIDASVKKTSEKLAEKLLHRKRPN